MLVQIMALKVRGFIIVHHSVTKSFTPFNIAVHSILSSHLSVNVHVLHVHLHVLPLEYTTVLIISLIGRSMCACIFKT